MASPTPTRRWRLRPAARPAMATMAMATLAVALGAVGAVGCTSVTTASSSTSSTTSSSTTTTTALDPGPGPTTLEGVGIGLEQITPQFGESDPIDTPVAMAARPGRNQLWIADRAGHVRILSIDTKWNKTTGKTEHTGYTLLPGDALDISELTSTDGERGLLGLAFSSDGLTLYVDHTAANGDIQVAAYTLEDKRTFSGGTGTRAPNADTVVAVDTASRIDLLTIPHGENSNHNGGQLALGPDGYLYIGVGDGGGAGDVPGNAQNTDTLLGKILRIDPPGAAFGLPYAIPPDNPFVSEGGLPEIYLSGVRNPWRFSFDRDTGDLWIGDVGQDAVEEIDWLPADTGAGRGANLGWNWFEGDAPFRTDATPPDGLTAPLATYTHDSGACSITGGYVYRGTDVPGLEGTYLYGDHCTGEIRGLLARKGIVLDDRSLGAGVAPETLASFGQDEQGELYVLSMDGAIYRVVP